MIKIEELESLAKKKENDNQKFRRFLKTHADPELLDEQFKQLHDKYFALYDCKQCRNCCIKFCGNIPINEIEIDAKHLGMTSEKFKEKYLEEKPNNGTYITKNVPCDFYVNNECILGECKPESCKSYPHTNKEGRLFSLYNVIDNTFVCPVVFEIIEELKTYYSFH